MILIILPLPYSFCCDCTANTRPRQHAREGAAEAAAAPVLNRHIVVVLVDRLDLATARALQYARTFTPTTCGRCTSTSTPRRPGARGRVEPLGPGPPAARHHGVPDRRLGRAAIELVADAALRRRHRVHGVAAAAQLARVWQRFLHDRTADKIAAVLGQVPHVNATIVPFAVGGRFGERVRSSAARCNGRAWGAPRTAGRRRSMPRRARVSIAWAGATGPGARAPCWPPTRRWPSGPAPPRPSPRSCRASASGSRGGSSRSGSSPGRAPRTSNAC